MQRRVAIFVGGVDIHVEVFHHVPDNVKACGGGECRKLIFHAVTGGGLHGGSIVDGLQVRIGTVCDEDLHGRQIVGLGGSPKSCRAGGIDPVVMEAAKPNLLRGLYVGIGALIQQSCQQVEVVGLFLAGIGRRIPGAVGPLLVHYGISRRQTVVVDEPGICAMIQQILPDVIVSVVDGLQHGGCLVSGTHQVHIHACGNQSLHGFHLTIARGKMQSTHTAHVVGRSHAGAPGTGCGSLLRLLGFGGILWCGGLFVVVALVGVIRIVAGVFVQANHARGGFPIGTTSDEEFGNLGAV